MDTKEKMTKKAARKKVTELLKLWGGTRARLKNYRLEYKEIMAMCSGLRELRAVCYENTIFSKNKNITDVVGDTATRVIDEYNEKMADLENRLHKTTELRDKVEDYVEKLDMNRQLILRERFIRNVKWEFIPPLLPVTCSLRQCYREYNTALDELWDMMKGDIL